MHTDRCRAASLAFFLGQSIGVYRRKGAKGIETRPVRSHFCVRTVAAKSGNRAEYDIGFDLFQIIKAETEPVQNACPHSFDDDIGFGDQFQKSRAIRISFQVKLYAPLAPVPPQVQQAFAIRRTHGRIASIAHAIACTVFDFNDVCPQIGKVSAQA